MPDPVISHITKGRVAVISPQGKAGTIPEEQLSQALDFGYQAGPDATKALHAGQLEARLQADYGGVIGGIHAASAGMARGFTLGTSDYLLDVIGGAEEARLAKEQNVGLATAGELGAIGATLLTGTGEAQAASMLAKLGRGGVALERGLLMPRTIARMGEGVAKGTEALIGTGGGLLARAGRKGLQMAAQGGAEGAIYGLGHGLSERALGNPDMTAEKLMSSMGHGALLGGGLGAGLGITGEVAGTGLRALAGLAKKRAPALGEGGTEAAAFGGARAGTEGAAVAEGKALATGEQRIGDELAATGGGGELAVKVEPGNAEKIQTDLLKAQAMRDPAKYHMKVDDVAEEASHVLAKEKDVVDQALPHARGFMDGEGKREIAKIYLKGQEPTEAIAESTAVLTRFRKAISEEGARNPFAYKEKTIDKFNGGIDKVEKHLAAIAKGEGPSGPGYEAADAYILMDQFKRELGGLAGKAKGSGETVNKTTFQTIYDAEAKTLLENPKLFPGMADYQSNVNPLYSTEIGLKKVAGEMRAPTGFRADYNPWVEEMLNDPGKLKAALLTAGDAESKMKIQSIIDHADNRVKLLEAVRERAPSLTAKMTVRIDRAIESAAKVRDVIRDTTTHIQDLKKLQRMEMSESNVLADLASHIPWVGGGVSAVLRTDALSISRKAYAVQKFASAADQKLGLSLRSYVDSLLGVVAKAAPKTADATASGVTQRVVRAVVDTTRRGAVSGVRAAAYGGATHEKKDYESRRASIMQAAANPQATAERVAQSIESFSDAAPNVAAALAANVIRATQYLASIAPSPPAHSTITPTTDRWTPAQDDVDRWNRAFDVVDKGPSVVVDQLRRGRLIKEEVDALAVSHPNELERIKGIILDHVTTQDAKGKPIPYEAKLQLGTLFSFAADPSQDPATQMELQATYLTPKTSIGKQITQGGASKVDSKRFGSASDSIEDGLT